MTSAQTDLFSRSFAAAVLFGIVGGALLLLLGLLVAMDWRGVAARYTRWTQAWVPGPASDERFPRNLMRQRVIFGVIAAFGALLLVAGLISVTRRLS